MSQKRSGVGRPEPVQMDSIRVRVVRPRGRRGPQDGRHYWRAQVGERNVWVGWGTRGERAILGQLIAENRDLGVQEDRTVAHDVRTVRDLLEVWMPAQRKRGRAERTVVAYHGAARRLARSSLGEVNLAKVQEQAHVLSEWYDEARADYAPKTVELDLQILRAAWRWGRDRRLVPDRDLPKLGDGGPRRAKPKRKPYTPSPAEVKAVLEAMPAAGPPWASLIVELQVATGARVGELAELTWEHVRHDAGVIELDGKTGHRVVPLPRHLMNRLAEFPRTTDWVLGVRPSASRGVWKYLQRACDAAGVRRWTTHALRRLAVDRLQRAGVDVPPSRDPASDDVDRDDLFWDDPRWDRATGEYTGEGPKFPRIEVEQCVLRLPFSKNAKLVALVLLTYAKRTPDGPGPGREMGEAWPSFDRLVHETGLSRSTLSKAFRELESVGLVTRSPRRPGQTQGRRFRLGAIVAKHSKLMEQDEAYKAQFKRQGQQRARASRDRAAALREAVREGESVHRADHVGPRERPGRSRERTQRGPATGPDPESASVE